MFSVSNAESRRVFELVTAFEERQITLVELQEGLRPVSAETLQVVATFGSARDAFEPGTPRLHSARIVIRSLAWLLRSRC
jgi:hypothetical protein